MIGNSSEHDSAFDFRWIEEAQQTSPATPLGAQAQSSAAPSMAVREGAESKIVVALTIACTVMALFDLFLLASGL